MEKPKRGFNINIDFEYTNSTTIEKFLPLSQASLGKKDLSQPLKVLNKHWVENVGDLRLLVQEGQLRSIGLPVRLCVWIETEVSKISRVTDLPPGLAPEDVKVAVYDEDVVMSREAPQVFNYDSDFDTNGILYWLGTRGRTAAWQNPLELGCVRVTTSGLLENSHPPSCFVGRETVRGVTQSHENAWLAIDFIDKLISPTHYSLRHYDSWDTECLRDWKFEASNDLSTWILIKEHKQDTALHSKGGTATWAVAPDRTISDGFWRAFRVIMTGPNSNNHNYLACSGFEIYGELISARAPDLEVKIKPLEEKKVPAGAELSHDYVYSHDLDTKGIIYNVGTHGGQRPWTNPADAGLVLVTASSLMQDSASISYIVGREVVRCVTKPQPSSWFAVDLIDKTALLTHYMLRHYSSWDTEALRNWRFEASNDGSTWIVLSEHKNDQSLKAKGQPFTWQLTGIKKAYRHFRIFQTGENSNNHHYLSLSGFELYGKLFQTDGATPYYYGAVPKTTQSEFKYTADFDGRGVIHWLGTNYATEPWRNPVSRGYVVIRASSLAADSVAISAVVGQDVVRCVTKPEENSWFVIDLLGRSLTPTHYTMRHYSSWDTEALRNWLFQGSTDGTTWLTIREHKDDAALEGKGSTHTWPLTTSQKFSMFRVFQTGPNSNNHHYLALSGFELYGTLFGGSGKKRSHSGDRVSISHQSSPLLSLSQIVKHTGLTWDATSKGPFVEVFGKTATNAGSLDKWQMARSALSFTSGRHMICLKIDKDQQTSNTWRFIVGAIPASLDCSGSTQWVGSKGSWGYIAGTGGKCHHRAQSTPYGAKFGVDDVVGISLDFTAGTIEFYKNGVPQGVAFTKIAGPVHIAASLTAANSSISFCDWLEPLEAAPSDNPDVMMSTGSMLSSASMTATSSILGVSGLSSLSLSGSTEESKESATLGLWDPENKSKFLVIDNKQGLVTNSGSSDKWQSARSLQSFSTGQVELAVEIATSPETPNSWRLIVGVVPTSFTCLGTKQWVGAGGSWGYIAGTGGICSNMPVSVAYGEGWGLKGDVIGIKLDFTASTIEFLKNGTSQGVAFTDLRGPVHAAVSLTATNSSARLKIIKATS